MVTTLGKFPFYSIIEIRFPYGRWEGARDVVDIVVGNGHGDPISNSGLGCFHLTLH